MRKVESIREALTGHYLANVPVILMAVLSFFVISPAILITPFV